MAYVITVMLGEIGTTVCSVTQTPFDGRYYTSAVNKSTKVPNHIQCGHENLSLLNIGTKVKFMSTLFFY